MCTVPMSPSQASGGAEGENKYLFISRNSSDTKHCLVSAGSDDRGLNMTLTQISSRIYNYLHLVTPQYEDKEKGHVCHFSIWYWYWCKINIRIRRCRKYIIANCWDRCYITGLLVIVSDGHGLVVCPWWGHWCGRLGIFSPLYCHNNPIKDAHSKK